MAVNRKAELKALSDAISRYNKHFNEGGPLMDMDASEETALIEKHLAENKPLDAKTRRFWENHA